MLKHFLPSGNPITVIVNIKPIIAHIPAIINPAKINNNIVNKNSSIILNIDLSNIVCVVEDIKFSFDKIVLLSTLI